MTSNCLIWIASERKRSCGPWVAPSRADCPLVARATDGSALIFERLIQRWHIPWLLSPDGIRHLKHDSAVYESTQVCDSVERTTEWTLCTNGTIGAIAGPTAGSSPPQQCPLGSGHGCRLRAHSCSSIAGAHPEYTANAVSGHCYAITVCRTGCPALWL